VCWQLGDSRENHALWEREFGNLHYTNKDVPKFVVSLDEKIDSPYREVEHLNISDRGLRLTFLSKVVELTKTVVKKGGLQAIGPISGSVENTQNLDFRADNPVRHHEGCLYNNQFTGTMHAAGSAHIWLAGKNVCRFP